jgi:hypothetical protein
MLRRPHFVWRAPIFFGGIDSQFSIFNSQFSGRGTLLLQVVSDKACCLSKRRHINPRLPKNGEWKMENGECGFSVTDGFSMF